MSNIQFDTPANRIIAQQQPKNKFRIDTSLPDLSFLRQLSVQGRLDYQQGSLNVASITITPATGSTYFFYKMLVSNDAAAADATVTITNDGNQRVLISLSEESSGSSNSIEVSFVDSLVGDGTKQFVIAQGGVGAVVRASIFGWFENTSRIRDVTS